MTALPIDKPQSATAYHVPSQFQAALHAKCPRCRTGNMFANSMYGFKGQKMNEFCPHCHLKFEREPGYFYVAMFVSYAMNVAQMVTLAVGTYILTGSSSPWLYITILLGVAFALSPFNFRYSRVILLYWLTPGLHFNPDKAKEHTDI
ncbi:DUF983 domain-containing protein [Mucilaginibacter paludis]|uniref:DUF983 domain-containing protein n=1 Tax=Mucilaginibacter paludis DSM 18603 TaxID=714943 RepID=H1YH44_9SPHI|nr:DUF983 domain-containing protein [Mucilaginibacter paludis]EHQ24546.1 hypothetical protein Mucpa_0350 [Mucilaginibacter paludis DSM 18603]